MLIIVPAALRLVWAEELEKWLPHVRPSAIHVIESKADRLDADARPGIVVTSYEMMHRLTCDDCKGRGTAKAATTRASARICKGGNVSLCIILLSVLLWCGKHTFHCAGYDFMQTHLGMQSDVACTSLLHHNAT